MGYFFCFKERLPICQLCQPPYNLINWLQNFQQTSAWSANDQCLFLNIVYPFIALPVFLGVAAVVVADVSSRRRPPPPPSLANQRLMVKTIEGIWLRRCCRRCDAAAAAAAACELTSTTSWRCDDARTTDGKIAGTTSPERIFLHQFLVSGLCFFSIELYIRFGPSSMLYLGCMHVFCF